VRTLNAKINEGTVDSLTYVAEEVRVYLEREGEMKRWMEDSFGKLTFHDGRLRDALMHLKMRGAMFITTNYDSLLLRMIGSDPLHRSSSEADQVCV
jgi:hypothetical protein